ncbi:unnamed protein product [Sphenostylis stenocarpa]|uniref:Uncharacterized protein n=1 Tax=Sphenostylis stenocarpa TaxID=92480 RepID=A0AA86RQW4_9FABA|nr:unnamed protein product [Sphenostylis stenocarpa]
MAPASSLVGLLPDKKIPSDIVFLTQSTDTFHFLLAVWQRKYGGAHTAPTVKKEIKVDRSGPQKKNELGLELK